ncbi:hypothetical protein RND71_009883 [Anisodus tanguticus]|uniref:Uncharacterized protein n=1 Tax=Anisodus tanguticus TaxID=243964 RepID=A0AAE1SG82_9SOLA|nr:hypothetical protein RND71_009883 [Anisodus tanguticus]
MRTPMSFRKRELLPSGFAFPVQSFLVRIYFDRKAIKRGRKNLLFSSVARSVTKLREPYDVANLSFLLGLSETSVLISCGFAGCICNSPSISRTVIANALRFGIFDTDGKEHLDIIAGLSDFPETEMAHSTSGISKQPAGVSFRSDDCPITETDPGKTHQASGSEELQMPTSSPNDVTMWKMI